MGCCFATPVDAGKENVFGGLYAREREQRSDVLLQKGDATTQKNIETTNCKGFT